MLESKNTPVFVESSVPKLQNHNITFRVNDSVFLWLVYEEWPTSAFKRYASARSSTIVTINMMQVTLPLPTPPRFSCDKSSNASSGEMFRFESRQRLEYLAEAWGALVDDWFLGWIFLHRTHIWVAWNNLNTFATELSSPTWRNYLPTASSGGLKMCIGLSPCEDVDHQAKAIINRKLGFVSKRSYWLCELSPKVLETWSRCLFLVFSTGYRLCNGFSEFKFNYSFLWLG